MRRLHRTSVITEAKRAVPLPVVLAMAGVPIDGLPERGVAIKAWCPWSAMHPDGGREMEMRVYAGNDCYCFICALTMDPVSIAARLWSVPNPQAARRLLDQLADSEDGLSPTEAGGDVRRRAGAVAALARWADAHRVSRFSPEYGRCLDLADHISADEHVMQWIDACKKYLRTTMSES